MTARKAKGDRKPRAKKPKPEPKANGRPQHLPTPHLRQTVLMLVVAGYRHDQIAASQGIDDGTLRRHYRKELDHGKAGIDAQITQTAIQMALGATGDPAKPYDWRLADASMTRFYARTRMSWKEPKAEVALSGAVGHYDLSKLSDEELERVTDILERAAISGAAGLSRGKDEA